MALGAIRRADHGDRTAVDRWLLPQRQLPPCQERDMERTRSPTLRVTHEDYGTVTGPVSVDMEGVRRRKREMVEALVAIHVKKYQIDRR